MVMQLRQANANGQAVVRQWSWDPRNVAAARSELLNTLALWGLGEVSDSATLVLSELLTNALRHTRPSAGDRIETAFLRVGPRLRIEVHDGADEQPVPRPADLEAPNGRGLMLVTALADSWNVMPRDGGGKITWAEISASPRAGDLHGA
jgi:anti-sigma regulatory factor (Ser/Thr protein kinase)